MRAFFHAPYSTPGSLASLPVFFLQVARPVARLPDVNPLDSPEPRAPNLARMTTGRDHDDSGRHRHADPGRALCGGPGHRTGAGDTLGGFRVKVHPLTRCARSVNLHAGSFVRVRCTPPIRESHWEHNPL
jgi:hypothetical protein